MESLGMKGGSDVGNNQLGYEEGLIFFLDSIFDKLRKNLI